MSELNRSLTLQKQKLEKKEKKRRKLDKVTVKLYVYMLLALLVIVTVFLYLSFTITLYPLNYIWATVLLMITIVGFVRGFLASLVTSLFIIFGYGSLILYRLYFSQVMVEMSLNDIFWLLSFPACATVSGLLGNEFTAIIRKYQHYENTMQSLVTIDETTGLANERQFREDLWIEVSRSQRYGHSMTLLLMEIAYYNEMLKDYGEEKTRNIVKQVVQQIDQVLRNEDKRAYLGNGVFSAILPETPVERMEIVIKRINENLKACTVETFKGKRLVEIKLKYGYAGCPEESQLESQLIEMARKRLGTYVV